jgi:site-specific DNA-methyltransferase (adenine-specific)
MYFDKLKALIDMTPMKINMNTLFYGDNLLILREYIADESVDLVYLDPPFNSARTYNVLFRDEAGKEAEAQIAAFEDTWHWNQAAAVTYHDLLLNSPDNVARMIEALYGFIGANQMMAYLVMMAARLVELHRVLKATGSLYLHCDSTASHYLKIVLDAIFGAENFRNEIIWKRTSSHNDVRRKYADVSDTILFYSRSDQYRFKVQYTEYDQKYVDKFYRFVDDKGRRYRIDNLRSPNPRPNLTYEYKGYKPHPNGWAVSREKMEQLDAEGRLYFPKSPDGRIQLKRFLDEMKGLPVGNVWDDILPIQAQAAERLGYPTQKPIALLERIIEASSNSGDVILDPFAGCGTSIAAAQKLGRTWIAIDITNLAVALNKYRLRDMFGDVPYQVIGEPEDLASAKQLASEDRYQFQWWALSLVQARPLGGEAGSKKGKKGSDRGIDGVITFLDGSNNAVQRVIVQVKSGHVKSGDIRDLKGTLEREKAAIGLFITLEPPSRDMEREAAESGFYISHTWGKQYPKVQILTIEALLRGASPALPPSQAMQTFKRAKRVAEDEGDDQLKMNL